MQQFSSPSVQKELENSIKALDQARKIANLVSLKQSDETFLPQESPDVQQQLDSFKTEVNSKLDTILQTIKSTEKPAFVFGKPTNNTKTPICQIRQIKDKQSESHQTSKISNLCLNC
jgi:hypothetical protein